MKILFVIGFVCVCFAESGRLWTVQVQSKNAEPAADTEHVDITPDGAVHIPNLTVPFSNLASEQAKAEFLKSVPSYEALTALQRRNDIAAIRRLTAPALANQNQQLAKQYQVAIEGKVLAGVRVSIVAPKGNTPPKEGRILINMHGGGFYMGDGALNEAIPLAGVSDTTVVAINYRLAPESKFPAASEDVVTVYRELLKDYSPNKIGLYGCSAGGLLAAESIAWIAKEKLPRPGAVGIFCSGAGGWNEGDSGTIAPWLMGYIPPPTTEGPPHQAVTNIGYLGNADMNDPLVAPIHSLEVLRNFPPTLVITSTRDLALSSAVYTHTRLVEAGVDAELHVWEGLPHGFFVNSPDLPESKEAWRVIAQFFNRHLGGK